MRVVCPICKTEYDAATTHRCPICNVPIDGRWPQILGSETVYIKRTSGNVFGPLPGSKIGELADKGLIKDAEMLSLDRQEWTRFSDLRSEIDSFAGGAAADFTASGGDMDLLDVGAPEDLPGLKEEADLLDVKAPEDLPGLKEEADLLDVKAPEDLPDVKEDADLLEVREFSDLLAPSDKADRDLLSMESLTASTVGSKPLEVGTYEHGSKLDIPDDFGGTASSDASYMDVPDAPDASDSRNKDAKRTVFGMPSMDLSGPKPPAAQDGKKTMFGMPAMPATPASGSGGNASKDDRVPSGSLLAAGDGLLGGDSGGLLGVLDTEGLDELDEPEPIEQQPIPPPAHSMAGDQGIPLDQMDDAQTIQLADTDDHVSYMESDDGERDVRSSGGGGHAVAWLAAVLVLAAAVIGGDWMFGYLGLFGGGSRETASGKPVATKSHANHAHVRKVKAASGDILPFTVSYPKLVATSNARDDSACEAALLLAFLHHDFARLDACSGFSGQKIQPVGDVRRVRIGMLRYALLVTGVYPPKSIQSFWGAGVPADLRREATDYLKQAMASMGRDPSVLLYAAYLTDAMGQSDRAREYMQKALDLEPKPREGLTFMASTLGIGEGSGDMWRHAGKVWGSIRSLRNEYVPVKRKFPAVRVPDTKQIGRLGPRFTAVMEAAAAYSAWQAGRLDDAFRSCSRALKADASDWDVLRVCEELALYHGRWDYMARMNDSFDPRRSVYAALWYVLSGKRGQAYGMWEDLKAGRPKIAAAMAPLFSALVKKKMDMAAAFSANRPVALTTFVLLRRFAGALAPDVWNRKDLPESVSLLIRAVGLYHAKKWKELASLPMKGWEGPWIPSSALVMLGRYHRDGRVPALDKKVLARIRADAYGAAYIMITGQNPEIAQELAKHDDLFADVIYLSAAASYILSSKADDRLVRARFLIERASAMALWNMEVEFLAGKILLESGRIQEGEERLSKAIAASPKDPRAFLDWADIEVKLRRMRAAIEALDRGLEVLKDDPRLLFRKAEINLKAGRPRSALKALKRIKGGIPMYRVYLMAGRCHELLRNDDEAASAYAKAVRACSSCPEPNFRYGKALLSEGRTRQSIPYLKRAIANLHDRTDWLPDAHRLLGGAYKELGRRREAIKHFRAYAGLVPPGPMRDEALRLIQLLE